MTNDWIIDVLADLKKFSASNHLGRLAEQIDDTIMIASNELALHNLNKSTPQLVGNGDKIRGHAGSPQPGSRA